MASEEAVRAVAARQWGVFSAKQAESVGAGSSTRSRWLSSGRVELVLPSVFRFGGTAVPWEQPLMAAVLWAGHRSVLSHHSAARLWGLDGVRASTRPSLIVPRAQSPEHSLVDVHRSHFAPENPKRWRGLLPYTNLARTVIDLAEVLDDESFELMFDSAGRKASDLVQWLQREARRFARGRRGLAMLRRHLARRATPVESALEVRVRRALLRAGIPMPHVQQEVFDGAGEFIGRVDFMWFAQRVVVEADGWRFHGNRAAWERDSQRKNRLVREGWRVFTVTSASVDEKDWLAELWMALSEVKGARLGSAGPVKGAREVLELTMTG